MQRIGSIGTMAMALWLAGCTHPHPLTRLVEVPLPPPPPGGALLDACANHAAHAQRMSFGQEFRGLQLDTYQAVLTSPAQPVGSQQVAAVYDGEGTWFGRPQGTQGEWRKVHYHCLLNPAGQVVYSFIRAQ